MPLSDTSTATQLLDELHDCANESAWQTFDRRFRPLVFRFARQLGLDEADAADVAQETLARFVQDYRAGKYDRSKGRLRSWLVGIAKYRVADIRRARARRRETRGESGIGDVEGSEAEALWEAEERRLILEETLRELRASGVIDPVKLEAFERVALRNEPVRTVAMALGLTPQAIYDAKSRIVGKLQDSMKKYETWFVEA